MIETKDFHFRGFKMVDMNRMISGNILAILKQQNKKQVDLAEALHTNKQTVNKMLNGARMINAVELKQIADFLGVKMEELTKIRENGINSDDTSDMDIVHVFMGKVESEQAKNALEIADKLSDMILFHSRVRENGVEMMEAWDC
jgi:transcriptional regulator with XRE-family HTH domain